MTSRELQLIRKFKGSPFLEVKNVNVIASGESENLIIDKRFFPYDDVTIFNASSDSDAEITINYNQVFFTPRKNSFQPETLTEFVKVKNLGSVDIAIGEIKVMYRNTGWKGKQIIGRASNILQSFGFLKILGGL